MNQPIYLLVGVPGSGKTWICNAVKDKFTYLPHDSYMRAPKNSYINDASRASATSNKPILIETPFSVSQILNPLVSSGHKVIPLFIIEDPHIIKKRYEKRENKPIPSGHLTRIETYMDRAHELGAFYGSSQKVLEFLQGI